MAGLDIIGGIGKGLMQGSQFVQQQRQAEQANRFNEARLGVMNEQMAQQKAERERVKNLTGVYQKYGDKDWSDPATFDAMTREALPHMTPQELSAVQQQSAALRKIAGADAVNRFAYAGDLSGFQKAIDKRMPGAKLANEGGMLTITNPDGTKQNFTDAKGLAAMVGMTDALERLQAIDAQKAEGFKDRVELDNKMADTAAKRALAGVRNRAPAARGGSGGAGSRSGSGSSAQGQEVPPYARLGLKNQKDMAEWLAKSLPEGGVSGVDANGNEVSIQGDQLLRETETNLSQLLGANPKLDPTKARDMAVSMAKAKAGFQLDDGHYIPVPQLNTETGEWQTAIRDDGKVIATVPSAVVEPTPEQVFEQESNYASQLSDQIGVQLTKMARSPDGNKALMLAMRDPASANAVGAQLGISNLSRKIEILYAYTGLGGAVIPDTRLQAKRAQVLRTRDELAKKAKGGDQSAFSQAWERLVDNAETAGLIQRKGQ